MLNMSIYMKSENFQEESYFVNSIGHFFFRKYKNFNRNRFLPEEFKWAQKNTKNK